MRVTQFGHWLADLDVAEDVPEVGDVAQAKRKHQKHAENKRLVKVPNGFEKILKVAITPLHHDAGGLFLQATRNSGHGRPETNWKRPFILD